MIQVLLVLLAQQEVQARLDQKAPRVLLELLGRRVQQVRKVDLQVLLERQVLLVLLVLQEPQVLLELLGPPAPRARPVQQVPQVQPEQRVLRELLVQQAQPGLYL